MMKMKSKMMIVVSVVVMTGCMGNSPSYGYGSGFGRVTYDDANYIYGTNQPALVDSQGRFVTREELEKYNGIRIGSDGYVKSLVQLPVVPREQLPHYSYIPPDEFKESYAQERGWKSWADRPEEFKRKVGEIK